MAKSNGFVNSSVKVEGLKRLRRTLKQAGADVQQLRDANLEAARVIMPIAAGLAPMRTGTLKSTVRAGATQRAGIVRAGKKLVPYAAPRHWGWPSKGWPASMYLTRAAQGNEHLWLKPYMKAVNKAANQVKGK